MLEAILKALNARKNNILSMAEMALHPKQFEAFRRQFLNELGQKGLESDLVRILAERKPGMERHGRE